MLDHDFSFIIRFDRLLPFFRCQAELRQQCGFFANEWRKKKFSISRHVHPRKLTKGVFRLLSQMLRRPLGHDVEHACTCSVHSHKHKNSQSCKTTKALNPSFAEKDVPFKQGMSYEVSDSEVSHRGFCVRSSHPSVQQYTRSVRGNTGTCAHQQLNIRCCITCFNRTECPIFPSIYE